MKCYKRIKKGECKIGNIFHIDTFRARQLNKHGAKSSEDMPRDFETVKTYWELSTKWFEHDLIETYYEGYPLRPPKSPPREDMHWYCSKDERFGVWILHWTDPHKSTPYRRSTLVQKALVPSYQPHYVRSVEERYSITWVVDQYGYGRYGWVMEDGYVWLPQ